MNELDYMRGFAIIAIVTIHVMGFALVIDHPNIITPIANYLTHLADFGVPLFLLISGYILGLRYFGKLDPKRFYGRRLKTILLPYIFFAFVYAIFNWFFMDQRSINDQLISFILFSGTRALWFVAVIIQLYLLFPYLVRFYKRLERTNDEILLLIIPLAIYLLWYAVIEGAFINSMGGYFGVSYYYANLMMRLICLPYLVFFTAGMYLSRHRDEVKIAMGKANQWIVAVLALLLALVLQFFPSGFIWSVFLLPFVALMSISLYRLSLWLKDHAGMPARMIRTVGLYSYGIYLVHMLAISIVTKPLYTMGLGVEDALFYILMMPGVVAISVLIIYILGRLPYGRYLSGIKTGPKSGMEKSPGQSSRGVHD
ncbi:MAG: acyltransferase [Methanomassiliicoccus sp.]|nr:acyltransferase [Methanomassiliicoccus sp.]